MALVISRVEAPSRVKLMRGLQYLLKLASRYFCKLRRENIFVSLLEIALSIYLAEQFLITFDSGSRYIFSVDLEFTKSFRNETKTGFSLVCEIR